MVYHGPKAMEELVRFDPHLVVGILGGSAGTTRDAFQLLHDAQKSGAKVALFGRKINNAESQLAFVHFLRLIVEGQLAPAEAVKAYHAVLAKLGLRPHRSLDDDLRLTDQSMSYAGATASWRVAAKKPPAAEAVSKTVPTQGGTTAASSNGGHTCECQAQPASSNGVAARCDCRAPVVTESATTVARYNHVRSNGASPSVNGRPDFAKMTPAERLAYHRERLGLGR
jgi:hypothetical protein